MAQSVASSDVSESGEEGHAEQTVLSLAMRALQNLKVAIESDSVRAHKRAVAKLCQLKLRLQASDELSKDVAQVLVSAGAMVGRAVTFAKNEDDAADLGITMSLLFGLVILCKTCLPARDEEELDGLKATLAAYDAFTIDGEREGYIPHHVAAGALLRLWSTPDGVAPTAIARHAAQRFFRATSGAMFLNKILLAADDDDEEDDSMFCSLSVGAVLQEANPDMQEKRLQGIVDGADSEVGQSVCRLEIQWRARSNLTVCFSPPGATRPHPLVFAAARAPRRAEDAAAHARGEQARRRRARAAALASARRRHARSPVEFQ